MIILEKSSFIRIKQFIIFGVFINLFSQKILIIRCFSLKLSVFDHSGVAGRLQLAHRVIREFYEISLFDINKCINK